MTVQPKVLIVDDEERFRTNLVKLLGVRGLEAVAVGSGMEAVKEIREHPYDVIILDVKMPEMDGIQTLEEIKKINASLEVIILTGHASVDAAVEIMRLGGYEYMLKPYSTEELIDKIERAFERKQVREKGKPG